MLHLLRPKGHFVILYLRQIDPQGVWLLLLLLTWTDRKKDFFAGTYALTPAYKN